MGICSSSEWGLCCWPKELSHNLKINKILIALVVWITLHFLAIRMSWAILTSQSVRAGSSGMLLYLGHSFYRWRNWGPDRLWLGQGLATNMRGSWDLRRGFLTPNAMTCPLYRIAAPGTVLFSETFGLCSIVKTVITQLQFFFSPLCIISYPESYP